MTKIKKRTITKGNNSIGQNSSSLKQFAKKYINLLSKELFYKKYPETKSKG